MEKNFIHLKCQLNSSWVHFSSGFSYFVSVFCWFSMWIFKKIKLILTLKKLFPGLTTEDQCLWLFCLWKTSRCFCSFVILISKFSFFKELQIFIFIILAISFPHRIQNINFYISTRTLKTSECKRNKWDECREAWLTWSDGWLWRRTRLCHPCEPSLLYSGGWATFTSLTETRWSNPPRGLRGILRVGF